MAGTAQSERGVDSLSRLKRENRQKKGEGYYGVLMGFA